MNRGTIARSAALSMGALGLVLCGVALLRAQEKPAEAEAPKKDALWEQSGRCQTCHVEDDWGLILEPDPKEGFDHSETGFPLRGRHQGPECDDCHQAGLEALTTKCGSCHLDPHAGFNTVTCEQCHDERSWEVARTFAFHERTRFPLTGVHASISCEACHRNRRGEPAATLPTECIACHREDQLAATPNHIAAGFELCGTCHQPSTFGAGEYRHRTYQQIGAHAVTSCVSCHPGAVFAGTAGGGTRCGECHAADYAATVALSQAPGSAIPNHPGSGFDPINCAVCHPQSAVSFSTWDINGNPGQ